MTTSGPFRRYTCDRCHATTLVEEGAGMPRGWIGVNIHHGARLDQIKNLCADCTGELDRLLFPLPVPPQPEASS